MEDEREEVDFLCSREKGVTYSKRGLASATLVAKTFDDM